MKKVLFIILSSIIIISLSVVSCFAVADKSFYIDDLERDSSSTGGLVGSYTYSSVRCSRIYFGNVGRYCTYYSLPLNLIAGQTYFVTVSFARSSGFDCVFDIQYNNRSAGTGSIIYENNFNQFSTLWTSVTCSFVYDTNKQYLQFDFVGNSTGNYGYISLVQITRYNPNAELESKIDEQNSLINQQIEEQSEQFSQIYEQNSELQSQLFDDGETYSIPDIDLMEQYSIVENNPFLDGASDFESNNHIVNGVKAFATLFNLFWDGIGSDDSLSWIRYLVYLSAVVSLFLLIVGSISIRADTPSNRDYESRGRNNDSKYS